MQPRPRKPRYIVQSLMHASQIISAFRSEGEALRLRDLVERTGLTKMTCYRLLFTLRECGFVEKIGENLYRPRFTLRPSRKRVLGYAALGSNAAFPRVVQSSLIEAAERAQFELIVVDNRYDSRTAIRNADRLIKERVDLAIVFQADETVAPAIAAKFLDAAIPVIAIDIPHPGATYFGADNYRAGFLAGQHLARWANRHWEGLVEEILIIEVARAGSLPQARGRGIVDGIGEVLREPCHTIFKLDGDGMFGPSQDAVRGFLRRTHSRRILVGAATDPSALGALRAFGEAGRLGDCVLAGQNADPEGRAELRLPGTRMIGSVAYFPDRYGDAVIKLASDILSGRPTAPAIFMKHQFITRENVDAFYPNDELISTAHTW